MSRRTLIEKFARAHAQVKASPERNTDLQPGDQVRWVLPGRTRALWRGEIMSIRSDVYFPGDGRVCYFGVKVEFRAPSWGASWIVDAEEVKR